MTAARGDDDTIRVLPARRQRQPPARNWKIVVPAAIIAAVAVFLLKPGGITIHTEGEAAIDANIPKHLTVFRYRDDPAIIVLDFPGLNAQGLMLDRMAALTEKAGEPRGRVLSAAEFRAALAAAHETTGTYYYGHDYPASAIVRFFRLAQRDNVTLNPSEDRLRTLIGRLGWQKPDATGAIISISAAGAHHRVTPHERAVILRHELSHGAFFTNSGYRAYVRQFWNTALSPAQRQGFRAFLSRGGYDTGDETLMMNEAQAYLAFTRDPQFFDAAAVGIPGATIDALRARFIAGMPDFWLKRLAWARLPQ